jgi:hypothetical protein
MSEQIKELNSQEFSDIRELLSAVARELQTNLGNWNIAIRHARDRVDLYEIYIAKLEQELSKPPTFEKKLSKMTVEELKNKIAELNSETFSDIHELLAQAPRQIWGYDGRGTHWAEAFDLARQRINLYENYISQLEVEFEKSN